MELGATVCRARTAECERCPLQFECCARPTIQSVLATVPRAARRPEPKFETSSRYFRGKIIDALRSAGMDGLSLAELGGSINPDFTVNDAEWIAGYVAGLQRDGLLARVDEIDVGQRLVAEESLPYDVETPDLNQRFRLPD